MSDDVLNSSWAAQLFPVVQAVKYLVDKVATAVAMRRLVRGGGWTWRQGVRGSLNQISQKVAER